MDKRWYPAAMTVVLVGCSGNGYAVYGPAPATGGNTATVSSTGLTGGSPSPSIDGGAPSTTGGSNGMGGMQTMYGPALTGGAAAAGGSAATGGKSPSGGATNGKLSALTQRGESTQWRPSQGLLLDAARIVSRMLGG